VADDAAAFDKAFWDERYRSSERVWSGRPNPVLVTEATGLAPGDALDIGAGEGADAVWLAERGWQVTAVDLSDVALQRAALHAAGRGNDVAGRIAWRQADITGWAPPASSYDLVSSQFMHLPSAQRPSLFAALAAAVRPGGTLLVAGHHPSDLRTSVRRPRLPDLMFTPEEVAGCLPAAGWQVEVCEAQPHDAVDPDGVTVTVHDSVLRATRRCEPAAS
jgi:SAM-dependent methyltransferase